MARPGVRLSRDVIIESALRLARRTIEEPGQAPTGKSIGDELSVDRSAIWRHFADKEDLLLAIADAMFGELLGEVDLAEGPAERLRAVWQGAITAFLRYPTIGAQLGSRWIAGPHSVRITDTTLAALADLGVPPDAVGIEYRAFIDLTLSYSAMLAQHSLRTRDEQRRDEIDMEVAIRGLDPVSAPHLAKVRDGLFAPDEAAVSETIISTVLAGLTTRYGS